MKELPQILLVEKEQAIIDQIVVAAESTGFQPPVIACSFEEAIKISEETPPGVALVDFAMEGKGEKKTSGFSGMSLKSR